MASQLIFLGAPGSGKGTQAARVVSELGYVHLSTGDLLRSEIKSGSVLGKKVTAIMDAGKLVDDQTMIELLKANCDLSDKNYIFDGYPRNGDQAKVLDSEFLKGTSSKAIYFDIDLDLLAKRLVNRRTCGDCGEIYNLISKPPKTAGVCDKCGGHNLQQRKDDNEETVKTRLGVFREAIEPVLAHYQGQDRLIRVDASASSDAVFNELKQAIK
ncbi:MAG: adenylate kinase [Bdellovibrionales bacterium CG12_big_fil_rev_8_21_14_0_65_38_15]|nr:MAG: adenylate kinase [Bdellovibrionales bacterium CG22_combo_CG10-13_8_21_14_all_38_13]PIQ55444.1 MAG: adenylate kinase [Bdellovibrionales bacterium CG12_big_fil_rev_8_21_14_0_65_38_15]PIR29185.1 MAG: adenylate kinase [Bdellovibrionales bacterium CG11_big_fil_rev_8_21_14_0_20_38_13]